MSDLTRWNRAGLARFAYVEGNAALFLERLRAAMIAKYLRGIPVIDGERDPDFWYGLLKDAGHPGPDPTRAAEIEAALGWSALQEGLARTVETKARRNRRLEENYAVRSDDYAYEIMRAFARAGHVLAGYTDAYMNEGYLATATQWDSVAKLAAMVNYSPVPAASASTTVALVLGQDSGVSDIKAGLAMSAPAKDGGAPLVFETLDPVTAHPDLNAARERRWHVNRDFVDLTGGFTPFLLEGATAPAPGVPVVVAPSKMTAPAARATIVARTRPGKPDETIQLQLDGSVGGPWRIGYLDLWTEPDQTLVGRAVTSATTTIVTAGSLSPRPGTIVEVAGAGSGVFAVVTNADNGQIALVSESQLGSVTGLRPLTEVDISEGYFEADTTVSTGYFNVNGTVVSRDIDTSETIGQSSKAKRTGVRKSDGNAVAHRFASPNGSVLGGIRGDGTFTPVVPVGEPPNVTPALQDPNVTVAFDGKPPKSLSEGQYFAARAPDGKLLALRVRGVREDDGIYYVAFDKAPPAAPEATTFFGPMKTRLRIEGHDRSTAPALDPDGYVMLAGLSEEAKSLIRVGNRVIIEDERETGESPVLATVDEIAIGSDKTGFKTGERDQARVRFAADASKLSNFIAGWTVFRFNTTRTGHGESKGGKTLGSGNAEQIRQSFRVDVKSISFVPDSLSVTGVRPDIEVRVDDEAWHYADLTDPAAEGTQSYSVRPKEDGTLEVHFRRRLPSSRNSARITRHRLGAGSRGNNVPAGTFKKPKVKHPQVRGIRQPFPTSGGADREAADSIRETAGASIAANGRAVSLEDFTRLTRRHAAVWDAKAERRLQPGRGDAVDITVVPAGGGELTEDLRGTLGGFVRDRSLPGVNIAVQAYEKATFSVDAVLRYDPLQFAEEALIDTASAHLFEAFTLSARRLAQALFVAEPLAVLEQVPGAEKVQLNISLPEDTTLQNSQVFRSDAGVIRALYPNERQVAFLATRTAITLRAEPLT